MASQVVQLNFQARLIDRAFYEQKIDIGRLIEIRAMLGSNVNGEISETKEGDRKRRFQEEIQIRMRKRLNE